MELVKSSIKSLIRHQRDPLLFIIKQVNHVLRKLSSLTHKAQLYCQWAVKPNPEWFDHFIDQHYQWTQSKNPLSWERGIFNLLAIGQNATVLEMCCGDGFNAYHFYAIRAAQIISIDFDPQAIKHATKHFKSDKIDYQVRDIRQSLPEGKFSNIIWDAAIEHFTLVEMDNIFNAIMARLTPQGVLSGYTIIAADHGASHDDHEHEFESKEELKAKLVQFFKHVVVFDTKYPDRHNVYFFASQAPLNFLADFQATANGSL
ncbi:MAG: class I SAM-dependent methyltransferase [Proteobacteria bacterium]|nr:class I SAM-dependent methyltransferase [Pseudomonadota bacterium]